MKKSLKKRRVWWKKSILFPCLAFVVSAIVIVYGIIHIEELSVTQNVDLLRQSVKRTVIECYAIEGSYPPDVAYMEENYGLVVDHEKYYIEYDALAANLMPNFDVYERY